MPPKTTSKAPKGGIRAPATKWSNEEIDSIISQLKEQKTLGNTSDNGFKSTVWATIAQSFPAGSRKSDGRVIESKWSRLKKDYKEVEFLLECSGFGWDEQRGVVTAEPEVWAEIEKV
jgi:Myb/SANT-like DNA-binding domain